MSFTVSCVNSKQSFPICQGFFSILFYILWNSKGLFGWSLWLGCGYDVFWDFFILGFLIKNHFYQLITGFVTFLVGLFTLIIESLSPLFAFISVKHFSNIKFHTFCWILLLLTATLCPSAVTAERSAEWTLIGGFIVSSLRRPINTPHSIYNEWRTTIPLGPEELRILLINYMRNVRWCNINDTLSFVIRAINYLVN